jgi:hypothetical protein
MAIGKNEPSAENSAPRPENKQLRRIARTEKRFLTKKSAQKSEKR